MDRPEWARNADRVADRQAVIAAIDAAFGRYSRERLMTILADLGTPAGQVRSLDEVYKWEQTLSQGLLIEVEHPSLGTVALPGPPVRYDSGGLGSHRPPPTLGQHTDEVLAWLDSIDPPN